MSGRRRGAAELRHDDNDAPRNREQETGPERARGALLEDPPARETDNNRRVVAKERRHCRLRTKHGRVPKREIECEEGAASHREERRSAIERLRGSSREAPRDQNTRRDQHAIKTGGRSRNAGPPHEDRGPCDPANRQHERGVCAP